jgi:hypothetical protein
VPPGHDQALSHGDRPAQVGPNSACLNGPRDCPPAGTVQCRPHKFRPDVTVGVPETIVGDPGTGDKGVFVEESALNWAGEYPQAISLRTIGTTCEAPAEVTLAIEAEESLAGSNGIIKRD